MVPKVVLNAGQNLVHVFMTGILLVEIWPGKCNVAPFKFLCSFGFDMYLVIGHVTGNWSCN